MDRKPCPKSQGDPLARARLRWLEGCCLTKGLTALELRLAGLLALRYVGMDKSRQRFEEDGIPVAWPNQAQLAAELECTRQAIGPAARRLTKRGLLEITPGQGRGHSSEYRLIRKGNELPSLLSDHKRQTANREKAKSEPAKGKDSERKRQTALAPIHSSQSKDQPINHSNGDDGDFQSGKKRTHPQFEQIFKMWPNKDKDHGKALGAWINNVVKPGIDPEKVLKRARRWCRHWEATGGKRTDYLGRWLANEGWEDVPPDSEWKAMEKYQSRFSGGDGGYGTRDFDGTE